MPDWIVRADRLDLDREDDEGRASGAVLEFKGVPVLPVPALSFPISERRRSGWLPPTLGLDNKSGLDLSVPYYWNIAPHRDATFTPGLMSRRGVDLAGEFRYLENDYQGRINANLTPNDRLRDGRNRWGYFLRHNGQHDSGIDGIGRVGLTMNPFSVGLPPLPTNLLDLSALTNAGTLPNSGALLEALGRSLQNLKRCPGAHERGQTAEQLTYGGTIDCDPTEVPIGP